MGFEAAGGTCVYSCEKDRHARATYLANFVAADGHAFGEDVVDAVALNDIPDHDVLVAGFPCQPFSIAGVSKRNALGIPHGFDCPTQGTMFDYIHRVLETHQPAAFLLENVKNLRSHNRGATIATIRARLAESGYAVHERVIDARVVVPQHRERMFIVGLRDSSADDFDFDAMLLPPKTGAPVLSSILHETCGDSVPEDPYTVGAPYRVSDKYTLSPKLWAYLQGYAEKHRRAGNGFGFGLVGPDDVSRTLSARYYKDGAEILVQQDDGRCPRRLTPREAARLMGFEVIGGRRWELPRSDVQAYRQMGNAVVPQIVEAIARHMAPWVRASLGAPQPSELRIRTPRQLSLDARSVAA